MARRRKREIESGEGELNYELDQKCLQKENNSLS